MPAIFWLQCLALASSSRAWPAPTMLNCRHSQRRSVGAIGLGYLLRVTLQSVQMPMQNTGAFLLERAGVRR